jgi:twitching motility protein PilJ
MASSSLKREPDTGEENSLATTLQDNSKDAPASHATTLLAGERDGDGKHDMHQPEDGLSGLDSIFGNAPPAGKPSGDDLPPARTGARFQPVLWLLLAAALIVLVAGSWWVLWRTDHAARRIESVSVTLMRSQHLAESISRSISAGDSAAFKELHVNANALTDSVGSLRSDLGGDYAADFGKAVQLANQVGKGTNAIVAHQALLIEAIRVLRTISGQSDDLQATAEQVAALKVQRGAAPAEIAAAGQLVMLAQRMEKTANQILLASTVDSSVVAALDKDLALFHDTAQALLDGDSALHLPPARDQETSSKLQKLLTALGKTRAEVANVLPSDKGLAAARTAQLTAIADNKALIQALEGLQTRLLAASRGVEWRNVMVLLMPGLVILLTVLGLASTQLRGSRQRQWQAEQQRLAAERQQQETKRINDANQAAILRLMNELQTVAEGDLTQEATVTEDITGAIADSVNCTVEELRTLVGNVRGTVTRVTQTTSQVEGSSTELLAASTEQLREIHGTGQSVLDMAGRINQVSTQAQESAQVARQSLQAAASGLTAVQDSIGGMNAIRDQMQETSKRIKRLGESSQEIGEITELIADITEQTNVLALNAAIQAASAGEAGRGFSVVAEEVQRLAERSAGATGQIAALVKTIQTDTQDAVAAMERSTRGVVEGARLSDNAGTALAEIDRVSRRLAQIIEQISSATVQEAQKANAVADSIQHIFAVTEQAGQSTRSTAGQVRELARIADELRQSVARFKIA